MEKVGEIYHNDNYEWEIIEATETGIKSKLLSSKIAGHKPGMIESYYPGTFSKHHNKGLRPFTPPKAAIEPSMSPAKKTRTEGDRMMDFFAGKKEW